MSEQAVTPTPTPPGGAPVAPVVETTLDMHNPKDQATLRRAIRERPRRIASIDARKLNKWAQQLEWAADKAQGIAENTMDSELALAAIDRVVSPIRTGIAMEGLNLADEQRDDVKKIELQIPIKHIEGVDESKL